MQEVKLKITGMHCGSCEHFISMLISSLGGQKIKVNRQNSEALFYSNERTAPIKEITSQINESGIYQVIEIIN